MIINPTFPTGHVLFCDDVRQELAGKITVVGIYGDELTAYGVTPLALPQLSAVIAFRNEPKAEEYKVNVVVAKEGKQSGKETLYTSETTITPSEPDLYSEYPEDPHSIRFVELRVVARISPLILSEPCKITVRAYIGDTEVRLGTLRISIAPMDDFINRFQTGE